MATTQSDHRETSRAKEVLAFWERRFRRRFTSREAAEMQTNIEGVVALLAEWDRADGAVAVCRHEYDTSKD